MSRLSDALRVFIRLVVRQAWTVALLALVVSVVGFWFARQLRIDTDFSNLVPRDYPSVQALEALRETVGSEATVDVAIVSPSFEANKAFAEQLIPRALALAPSPQAEPYLNRVDFEKDTAFLEQNALYFATYAELDSLESYLRDKIRDAKLDANPFFFDLDDEEDESDDEAAYDPERDLQEVYDHIIGKRYPINEDSTIMALRFYPSGSQTDIGFIETLYDDLDALIVELTPTAYHPEMKVAPAGRLLRQLVEVRDDLRRCDRFVCRGRDSRLAAGGRLFFLQGVYGPCRSSIFPARTGYATGAHPGACRPDRDTAPDELVLDTGRGLVRLREAQYDDFDAWACTVRPRYRLRHTFLCPLYGRAQPGPYGSRCGGKHVHQYGKGYRAGRLYNGRRSVCVDRRGFPRVQ